MAPKHKATIIALANQKGGVAKTTSVASLGAAFAEQGRRVLLVDLDPQACLTFSLGVDPDAVESSVHDVMVGGESLKDVVVSCEEGIDLVPSTIDLAGAEAVLLSRPAREYVLQGALADVRRDYDIILLDCSPEPGRAHPQRPDRRARTHHPDAVRDAQPPRRRPAARHRARREEDPQQEAHASSASSRPSTTGAACTPARCSRTSAAATTCRCSCPRSRRRSASQRLPPWAARSCRRPAAPRAPRPTARSRP